MKLINEHLSFHREKEGDKLENLGIGRKTLIINWLKDMNIDNYIIKDDFSINVYYNVQLSNKHLNGKLPDFIQFGNVDGAFRIDGNNLTTLKGCARYVGAQFDCEENNLTTLDYAPVHIGGDVWCRGNNLPIAVINNYLRKISHKKKCHSDYNSTGYSQ